MASSGRDVPAERAAAAVNHLIEAREGVARLRSLILQQGHLISPWEELVDGVLNRLSSAVSALDGTGAAAGGQSPAAGSDGARQSVTSSRNATRKRSFGRRSQGPSDKRVTVSLVDGHIWRKYGQKEIQDSHHPRSYYRCTHKSDKGCNAKRQVQLYEADPSKYVVTYYGEHTCRDLSAVPLIVHAVGSMEPEADRAGNLISFATSGTNAASTGASSQMAMDGSATQLSTSWCTSDDVFSSSAGSLMQVDELGAVLGSARVMSRTAAGSAPDSGGLGDMMSGPGGGGTTGVGSFPSSPNSLELMVGSPGSTEDDDFFRLDP